MANIKLKTNKLNKRNKLSSFFVEKSKLIIITTVSMAVLVVALFLIYVFIFNPELLRKEENKITGSNLKSETDLSKAEGPTKPILSASLGGNYNLDEAICVWYIGQQNVGQTKPENGKCVFQHMTLVAPGDYKVYYKIKGTDFQSEPFKVTIN
jgi:hypothetical protein